MEADSAVRQAKLTNVARMRTNPTAALQPASSPPRLRLQQPPPWFSVKWRASVLRKTSIPPYPCSSAPDYGLVHYVISGKNTTRLSESPNERCRSLSFVAGSHIQSTGRRQSHLSPRTSVYVAKVETKIETT